MATIVHHDHARSTSDNGVGFVLGMVLLLAFIALFFIYAVPYLSSAFRGPQITVPDRIDVNIQNPK